MELTEHDTERRRVGARTPRLAFARRLVTLEDAVYAPPVPGELNDWGRRVVEALRSVERQLAPWRASQRAMHEEVARRDPALLHRVERLEGRLSESCERLSALQVAAEGLRGETTPRAAAALSKTILDWIVELRSLEREAATWWAEALYRDRGVAD